MEGKILNKFDMRSHNETLELYGKLDRERTNKYMVIENDSGAHMRPMPMMISFSTSGPSVNGLFCFLLPFIVLHD
ncbi:hypothetical protein D0Y65_048940 [Glycine soja]|uniref:Uncharacterized protein n=1 Tax=Glycine soja TaxID=3848 RepID=A0A445FUU7_GLYSO|nr:hypothetical protein D0Y65_048940 [Glycine soja]